MKQINKLETKKKKVLFICTGNVFRSMSAEKSFNKYIKDIGNNNRVADSAGTFEATQDYVDTVVLDTLKEFGIDASAHKCKKITKELILKSDFVIAMATYHQDFIKKNFGLSVPLFNEILKDESISVDDQDDVVEDIEKQRDEAVKHIIKTVKYLYNAIPTFFENIKKI